MARRHLGALLLLLTAAGCATLESKVEKRASADFGCSQERLDIVDRVQTVFRVRGCGEEATYVCTEGRNLRMRCTQADPGRLETSSLTGTRRTQAPVP